MCGRVRVPGEIQFLRTFDFPLRLQMQWPAEGWKEQFNFAPTQLLPIVRVNRDIDTEPEAVMMRWGLIPFFAHGIAGKYATINARIETMESSPAYRGPWKRGQRCIFPAVGFYEWHVTESGTKQPYYIHLNDQESFGMAGLWDRSIAADGTAIESCTIITMDANPLMADIHNTKQRMPAILKREDQLLWIAGSNDEAKSVLVQYPAESMVAWQVSAKVNSARNSGSELVEPLKPPLRAHDEQE